MLYFIENLIFQKNWLKKVDITDNLKIETNEIIGHSILLSL